MMIKYNIICDAAIENTNLVMTFLLIFFKLSISHSAYSTAPLMMHHLEYEC